MKRTNPNQYTLTNTEGVLPLFAAALITAEVPKSGQLFISKREEYTELSRVAGDPYQKRHVREAGADLWRTMSHYDDAVARGSSLAMLDNYLDSLASLAHSIRDMMAEDAPA